MKNCLITSFKDTVTDNTLQKVGELRIQISPSSNIGNCSFKVKFKNEATLSIIGDGYFTNSSYTLNLGTSITVKANELTTVYYSNGDYYISFLKKYDLMSIDFSASNASNALFDLEDFKYSEYIEDLNPSTNATGNLASITNLKKIRNLQFANNTYIDGDIKNIANLQSIVRIFCNAKIKGNIKDFSNCKDMLYITFNKNTNIYGNISTLASSNLKLRGFEATSSQVSGDIASLGTMTSFTNLVLSNTAVSGDIASLNTLTSLSTLGLSNTAVSGDIASLNTLTSLSTLGLGNTAVSGDIASLNTLTSLNILYIDNLSAITGDLSYLPESIFYVSQLGGTVNFTWTGKGSHKYIIAMTEVRCDNIDKLLNDMALLEANPQVSSTVYKTISLIGTRTSASDAAVATLQSKGYTVSITPA